jgi:hypothetical protein
MDIEQAKLYSDIATPLIETIVSTFIKPKIEKLAGWFKSENLKNQVSDSNLFSSKYEEYLERTFKRCKNINILVFPNQQIDIDNIYQPLTVNCNKNKVKIKVDKFYTDLIKPYHKVLISDTAGMGKSTLLKFLTLKIIEQNIGVPLLIDLRNLRENNLIIDEIYQQLNPIDSVIEKDLILKFIETGNFIFLFDGFDEIQQKNSEVIIRDIRTFIDKAHNNWFFLTSRPEPALTSFGDFQQFNIQPLNKEESENLINLYDKVSNFGIAKNLIKDIEPRFKEISSFLTNPFLVSLLYKAYTYTKDIPASKITFYDEIYSALFKSHDLSKDGWRRPKQSKLEIQQFRIVLRQLAFDTLKINMVSYSKQELLDLILKAKVKCIGINFDESHYLTDLLTTVPIFVEEGHQIKWAHKSFQDFFAAEYLSFDNKKEEKLNQIYVLKKSNYLNLLDLFYELDYKTFRRTIIRNLLVDFKYFDTTAYSDYDDYEPRIIDERKAFMAFNPVVYLYNDRNKVKSEDVNMGGSEALLKARDIEEAKYGRKAYMNSVRYSTGFGIVYYPDFRKQLLKLVLQKGEDFVFKIGEYGEEIFSNNCTELFSADLTPILDVRNEWYNQKEHFESMTKLLKNDSLSGGVIIKKNIALKTLEIIDKEWQSDLNSSADV